MVGLFVVPLVVYRAHAVSPRDANLLDRVILGVTAPLERLLSGSVGFITGQLYTYVDVVGAREDNIELRRSIIRLQQRAAESDALEAENTRLRALLGLRDRRPELRTKAATVVAAGTSGMTRTLRIDQGLVDGVARGMPVIADEGLVGRVQRAGVNVSEVRLITDEQVTLHVVIARSRAQGRLQGRGLIPGFDLIVRRILRTDDVRQGDVVVTSGLGGVYPAGIRVGIVGAIEPVEGETEQVLGVEPAVDFSRIEHVLVVEDTGPEVSVDTPYEALPPSLRSGTSSTSTSSEGRPR